MNIITVIGNGRNLSEKAKRIIEMEKLCIHTPNTFIISPDSCDYIKSLEFNSAVDMLTLYPFYFNNSEGSNITLEFWKDKLPSRSYLSSSSVGTSGLLCNIVKTIQSDSLLHVLGATCIVQAVQKLESGMHSARGKIFSKIPETGQDMLVGSYNTVDTQAHNIYSIVNDYPRGRSIFLRILDSVRLLENEFRWPQELDFFIKEDNIYFNNCKDMVFTPSVKMYIIDEFMKKQRMKGQDIPLRIDKQELNDLCYLYAGKSEMQILQKIKRYL